KSHNRGGAPQRSGRPPRTPRQGSDKPIRWPRWHHHLYLRTPPAQWPNSGGGVPWSPRHTLHPDPSDLRHAHHITTHRCGTTPHHRQINLLSTAGGLGGGEVVAEGGGGGRGVDAEVQAVVD